MPHPSLIAPPPAWIGFAPCAWGGWQEWSDMKRLAKYRRKEPTKTVKWLQWNTGTAKAKRLICRNQCRKNWETLSR